MRERHGQSAPAAVLALVSALSPGMAESAHASPADVRSLGAVMVGELD